MNAKGKKMKTATAKFFEAETIDDGFGVPNWAIWQIDDNGEEIKGTRRSGFETESDAFASRNAKACEYCGLAYTGRSKRGDSSMCPNCHADIDGTWDTD